MTSSLSVLTTDPCLTESVGQDTWPNYEGHPPGFKPHRRVPELRLREHRESRGLKSAE